MMWLEGGTTGEKMIEFIQMVLNAIGVGTPARRRCLIMDNLRCHHKLQVVAMILAAGHWLVFRAPYSMNLCSIPWKHMLRLTCTINVEPIGISLRHWTLAGIAQISNFVPYFHNCG
mmetsp:Transcript_2517/g.3581  ORF Transcript_2517/g.3581 Transcript_2517/m.3581 type:complete len:116 (+) Transcript_2517:1093-1440(+)